MTAAELIKETQAFDETVESIEDALEATWGHGFADAEFGSVDEVSHVFRVDRWLLETMPAGNKHVVEFETEQAAIDHFEKIQTQSETRD